MSRSPAISVDEVWKRFRIYHERNQSVKAALMRGGRARFEDFWALSDVSFDVREGTTVGLIGHNGSGKSTLLKCLARILTPDRGSVTIRGKVSALLELGAGFHQELSGRENIYLNGSILGMSKADIDRRFDEIVSFAGVEQFIDMPVKNYSSGMYVRLGFSIATSVEPEVLLIDEVLSVGDENFQRKCLGRISELRSEGRTVVVVSHALGTVRSICDEAVWLERGRVRTVGPASDVADQYLGSVHVEMREAAKQQVGERRHGELDLLRAEVHHPGRGLVSELATGDPMVIRMHYNASSPVPEPLFALSIQTVDGMQVTAPSTREAGFVLGKVHGRGWVDLWVDRLMLLPGTYDVSISCTDPSRSHIYDEKHRTARFEVVPGVPHETMGGIVSLGGRWSSGEGEAP